MKRDKDFRIRELGQTLLTLRADLELTPRLDGDHFGYLLEDKVNSNYFQIGIPEHTFISLLDGETTVSEALSIMARIEPEHAFTEEQAAAICQWLVENQLAFTTESAQTARLYSASQDRPGAESWARANPFFIRIPLFHPDKLFTRLFPWTGWIFSIPSAVVASVLVFGALYQVLIQWDRFLASSQGVLATDRWLWIAGCWLTLKVIHELAHGIVCKRYGGTIREAGVILILTVPVAYVDVTSSWRFRSRWQRIRTAAAGMYVELIVAALAVMVWSHVRSGMLSDLCVQTAIMASITTVLFNANPLMRFDGYYIASDLLGIPNLSGQSQQFLRRLARKYLLGVSSTPPDANWTRRSIIATYSVAAFIWRILVCVGLAITAATMFRGAGIILAVIGLVLWIGPPTLSTIKYLVYGDHLGQPRRLRFALTTGASLTGLTLAALFLPWPGAYRAPAVVEYAPLTVVRASSPGFVEKMYVRPGQNVLQGQSLVLLVNHELERESSDLHLAVQQSEGRVRALLYDDRMADVQAERKKLEYLRKHLHEKAAEVDSLIVRAPLDGTIVASDLESLIGTYFDRGAEILAIGSEDQKELMISIAHHDAEIFTGHLNHPAWVRLHGRQGFFAPLMEVSPRASIVPNSRALCAPHGGPLAVRVAAPLNEKPETANRYEFLTPRFKGCVGLNRELSRSLVAGQRGIVSLRTTDRSIADHLAARFRSGLRNISIFQTLTN